jgi:hypothetical protein
MQGNRGKWGNRGKRESKIMQGKERKRVNTWEQGKWGQRGR